MMPKRQILIIRLYLPRFISPYMEISTCQGYPQHCGKPLKQSFIFFIKGGIWPEKYRETTIQVSANSIEDAYDDAKRWCKLNFADWNLIIDRYDLVDAEIKNPVIPKKQITYGNIRKIGQTFHQIDIPP